MYTLCGVFFNNNNNNNNNKSASFCLTVFISEKKEPKVGAYRAGSPAREHVTPYLLVYTAKSKHG